MLGDMEEGRGGESEGCVFRFARCSWLAGCFSHVK